MLMHYIYIYGVELAKLKHYIYGTELAKLMHYIYGAEPLETWQLHELKFQYTR